MLRTDVYFVLDLRPRILAWHHLYTVSVEFPHPNKTDHFVHNDWAKKDQVIESTFMKKQLRKTLLLSFRRRQKLEILVVSAQQSKL